MKTVVVEDEYVTKMDKIVTKLIFVCAVSIGLSIASISVSISLYLNTESSSLQRVCEEQKVMSVLECMKS